MTNVRDSNPQTPRVFISFAEAEEVASPILDSIKSPDPVDGQQLSGYKVTDKIGEGAMAIVYKATQLSTGRTVAIKTLKFVDPNLAERFTREMSIHSNLKHENIVEAIDCISTPFGRSYFVMEYLNGSTLEDQLVNYGRANTPQQIATVLSQICNALECAHSEGIIHRDVKPENVILTFIGGQMCVKVLDFGVAKIQEDLQRLTKTGVVLGSPAYMSPEQCMGMDLTPRSDIYSLGVVAFELITGNLPYDADTAMDMMEAHCDPDIKPLSISAYRDDLPGMVQLQEFFDCVLQVEPEGRPESISEFKKKLSAWFNEAIKLDPTLTNPFTISKLPEKPKQKNMRVLATSDLRSLDKLSGRLTAEPEEEEEQPKPNLLASIPTSVIIGTAVLVLLGLMALLAFFILSAIKH